MGISPEPLNVQVSELHGEESDDDRLKIGKEGDPARLDPAEREVPEQVGEHRGHDPEVADLSPVGGREIVQYGYRSAGTMPTGGETGAFPRSAEEACLRSPRICSGDPRGREEAANRLCGDDRARPSAGGLGPDRGRGRPVERGAG